MSLVKPISVGPVTIEAPVILAPMTGVTDLPFRRIVKRYGAGLTVSEVQGYGRQGGKTETFRGSEYTVEFVPKVKLEILAPSEDVDKIIDTISEAARTGKIGDGKIWAFDLDRLSRVRTGEKGDEAI